MTTKKHNIVLNYLLKYCAKVLQTRMHSSRMRTGRTVTVFRKLEDPPKNLEQAPPLKFGAGTPPENLEQAPPRKFGAGTPPKIWSRHPPENLEQAPPPKIWSRHPPRKFGAGTPPVNRMTDRCKNITLAKTSFRPVKIMS